MLKLALRDCASVRSRNKAKEPNSWDAVEWYTMRSNMARNYRKIVFLQIDNEPLDS